LATRLIRWPTPSVTAKIEWIGVRHEEGAALPAAGQAKLTGRLGVCCGKTGPPHPPHRPASTKQVPLISFGKFPRASEKFSRGFQKLSEKFNSLPIFAQIFAGKHRLIKGLRPHLAAERPIAANLPVAARRTPGRQSTSGHCFYPMPQPGCAGAISAQGRGGFERGQGRSPCDENIMRTFSPFVKRNVIGLERPSFPVSSAARQDGAGFASSGRPAGIDSLLMGWTAPRTASNVPRWSSLQAPSAKGGRPWANLSSTRRLSPGSGLIWPRGSSAFTRSTPRARSSLPARSIAERF
jgi:hypothetical protein